MEMEYDKKYPQKSPWDELAKTRFPTFRHESYVKKCSQRFNRKHKITPISSDDFISDGFAICVKCGEIFVIDHGEGMGYHLSHLGYINPNIETLGAKS
jgi:hypothetical protein